MIILLFLTLLKCLEVVVSSFEPFPSDFKGGGVGGLRFWVLGLRSSFSIHPKKRVELPINGTPFGMVTARD